jgi:hypothetical protein
MSTSPHLSTLFAHAPDARHKGVTTQSRYLTMRDGTQIAIDVMLPADLAPSARIPALMIMARYWRSMELWFASPPNAAPIGPRESTVDYFVARGFALVVVDARGTGASFGVSRYPWSTAELADYGEVAAWITAQPWCSGRIGAYGISYEGATAERLIATGEPAVKAVIPQEIEYDVYTDIAFPGGILNEAFIRAWSESNRRLDSNKTSSLFPAIARLFIRGVRPVDADLKSRAQLKAAVAEHAGNTDVFAALSKIIYRDDPFGSTGVTLDDYSIFAHNADIEGRRVPLFNWGSWLDGAAAESALRNHYTYSAPQITVIGAWKHEMTAHGSPYRKPNDAPNPLKEEQWAAMAQFFQQTLIDDVPPQGKTLFYYTLGEEAWKRAESFPPPNMRPQRLYFAANHALVESAPGEMAKDSYTVDFEATTGVTNRWRTQMAQPLVYPDRAEADRRLLTYTSQPMTQDTEITGYGLVTLHVASSEDDGAFFVYLEDVDPQGVVRYITEGQLRGIHRKLADVPAPYVTPMPYRTFRRADAEAMPRGEFVELVIPLQPTSVLIRKGHSIRVALAGADKDTFARIPAQGIPTWQVGRGGIHASHITLPMITA